MKTRLVAVVALVAAGGGAWGVVSQADDGPRGLGQTAAGDRFAGIVEATPAPSESTPVARPRLTHADRQAGKGVRERLVIMRRPSGPEDVMPSWVKDAPGTQMLAESARRLRGVAGVPALWVATDSSETVVALAGGSRASFFLKQDLDEGRVLRVDEQLAGDEGYVAVTGVLPDGAQSAQIISNADAQVLNVSNGVYSARFPKTVAGLPRRLVFTDGTGRHEVAVPLSPDMPQ